MKALDITKTVISTGLALLSLTSLIMLATDKTLDTYQQCFVFGTMCAAVLIGLLINKTN